MSGLRQSRFPASMERRSPSPIGPQQQHHPAGLLLTGLVGDYIVFAEELRVGLVLHLAFLQSL
jgi:hypothetical protein